MCLVSGAQVLLKFGGGSSGVTWDYLSPEKNGANSESFKIGIFMWSFGNS